MIEKRCIDGTEIVENKCVSKYSKDKGSVLASEVCDETFMHYENGSWICKQSVHFRSDELPDTRYGLLNQSYIIKISRVKKIS